LPAAGERRDLFGGAFEHQSVEVREHHFHAELSEATDGGKADAAGCTGDDCHMARRERG